MTSGCQTTLPVHVAAYYILLILLLEKMFFLIIAVTFLSPSKISVRACDTSMASAERPEGEAFVSGQGFGAAEALPV